MLSTEIFNLYNNIFALVNFSIISLVIPFIRILSTLFILAAFNKYKNVMLRILGLATGSHVINNNFSHYLNL